MNCRMTSLQCLNCFSPFEEQMEILEIHCYSDKKKERFLSNSSRTKNQLIWGLSITIFLCKRIRKESQHLQSLYQIWLFVNSITRLLHFIFCHIVYGTLRWIMWQIRPLCSTCHNPHTPNKPHLIGVPMCAYTHTHTQPPPPTPGIAVQQLCVTFDLLILSSTRSSSLPQPHIKFLAFVYVQHQQNKRGRFIWGCQHSTSWEDISLPEKQRNISSHWRAAEMCTYVVLSYSNHIQTAQTTACTTSTCILQGLIFY